MTELQWRQLIDCVVTGAFIGIVMGLVIAIVHLLGLETILSIAIGIAGGFGIPYVGLKLLLFLESNAERLEELKIAEQIEALKKESEDKHSVKNR